MINLRLLSFIAMMLCFSFQAWAQDFPYYNIKASLDPLENQIKVIQKISYAHQKDFATNVIYLNDWNNAYSSTESPLAKRLVRKCRRCQYR